MIPKQDLLFEICDGLLLLLYTTVKSREPWTFNPRMALTQIHEHLRVAYTGGLGVPELKYTLQKEETKILFSLQRALSPWRACVSLLLRFIMSPEKL